MNRRNRNVGLAILGVALSIAVDSLERRNNAAAEKPKPLIPFKAKEVTECTVEVFLSPGRTVSFAMKNPTDVQKLVIDSINAAEVNLKPKDWAVLGGIVVRSAKKDQDVELSLYSPLGRFSRGKTYYSADLGPLGKEIAERMRHALRKLGK